MLGFKDDFDQWKASLTPDEQELMKKQAQGEFNKGFRKSDDFSKEMSEEKVQSFATILGKFFDNEADDYKREATMKKNAATPSVLDATEGRELDFTLTEQVVEVDRDAQRRYKYHMMKDRKRIAEGKDGFPQSSPQMSDWYIKNDDDASHAKAVEALDSLKKWAESNKGDLPDDFYKSLMADVEKGVPAKGEDWVFMVPHQLMNQLQYLRIWTLNTYTKLKEHAEAAGEWTAEKDALIKEKLQNVKAKLSVGLHKQYIDARNEIEEAVEREKRIYANGDKAGDKGMTKADVLKAIWKELPNALDKPVPPLDDETLAEFANEPAGGTDEDEKISRPWGTASMLYKSEAVDAFGMKYLLGIYETPEECHKRFDEWNAEYVKARAEQKIELAEWSKRENARLDKDPSGRERIQKVLEESRAALRR